MAKAPRISDAEWQVMEAVWAEHPATASQVVQRLEGKNDWNPPAPIKTMLGRLVRKGALAFEAQGKEYLYRPAVTRSQCLKRKSDSFLASLSDQLAMPALVHFVRRAKLSTDDIQELRRILDEKEK